jgi:hypothetical protein
VHPNPIDPHAAVSGLVEAFDEVLDLSVAVPLSVLASNHHAGLAAAAVGTDEPLAPTEFSAPYWAAIATRSGST